MVCLHCAGHNEGIEATVQTAYGPGISFGNDWEEKQKSIRDHIFKVIENTQRARTRNDWRTTDERRSSNARVPPLKKTGKGDASLERAYSKIDGSEDEGDISARNPSS
jgi:hypothetical protein